MRAVTAGTTRGERREGGKEGGREGGKEGGRDKGRVGRGEIEAGEGGKGRRERKRTRYMTICCYY